MSSDHDLLLSDSELHANHSALSPLWGQLLDFAVANPEFRDLRSFDGIAELEADLRYGVQPWPTFVDQRQLEAIAQVNTDLCRLIRELPFRLFGDDLEALLSFYGLGQEMLPVVRFARKRPQYLEHIVGRSDFLHTPAGFRCLEFNLSANLGGYQNTQLVRVLKAPLLKRFLAEAGAEVRAFDVVRRLLTHCIGCVLRHFRSPEINIALQVEMHNDTSAFYRPIFTETLQEVLAELGGVSGSIQVVTPEQLEARGGLLYYDDTRIHLVLENNPGPSTAATYRCWMNDSVLLVDGPLTPILSDKRNIALLSELAESALFSDQERALVANSIPWTRRLSTIEAAGHPAPRIDAGELLDRQHELVIKRATGSGGTEVFLGSTQSAAQWAQQVELALSQGDWIVQERLTSVPYLYQDAECGTAPHEVIWGFMAFGDRYGGDTLRMAPIDQQGVVNASRGARLGILWEHADPLAEGFRL